MSSKMPRGKTSILYRYLPGKVIDFGYGNAIAKIEGWWSESLGEKVNAMRVLRRVMREKSSFDHSRGYPRVLDPSKFSLLTPRSVRAEVYPLTFTCNECGKAFSFGSVSQLNRTLRGHKCNRCGGKLTQMDLIYHHDCGHLWEPKVPRCAEHGWDYVILNKHNSNSPQDWRWDCGVCHRQLRNLNNNCPACKSGGQQYPTPFRQSSVFVPHTFSMVNVERTENDKRMYEDEQFQLLVIADYLGLLEDASLSFEDALSKLGSSESANNASKIAELKERYGEDVVADLVRQLNVDVNGQGSIKQILTQVRSLAQPVEGFWDKQALRAYEFMRTRDSEGSVSIERLIRSSAGAALGEERHAYAQSALQNLGIANAHVLSDFSIANVVYGFTRGKQSTKTGERNTEPTLNAFPPDLSASDKTQVPIYMNLAETEAFVLEIDRKRISEWLIANGHNITMPQTEAELKGWFLSHIREDEISTFNEIDPETDLFERSDDTGITRDVYRLLHSMSHALLSTAATECGLDRNSLAEMIMPSIPAVIVYCSSYQQFQTGGLFTLFESHMRPWLDKATGKASDCLYDPVCLNHRSACHACLQTSEISCEHFNHDLGRDVLRGKHEDKGSKRVLGFWAMQQQGS